MKVLLVFMALLSLNLMFLTYQSDMNQYNRQQALLKSVAEECAAGAALFFDEEEFSLGFLKFNREESEKYVNHILSQRFHEPFQVSYEIDYCEYPDTQRPGVAVTLTLTGTDWFRLGFLSVKEIKRKAFYENLPF